MGVKTCKKPPGISVIVGKKCSVQDKEGIIRKQDIQPPKFQPQLPQKMTQQVTPKIPGIQSPSEAECNAMEKLKSGPLEKKECNKQKSPCKRTIEGIDVHFGKPTTIEIRSKRLPSIPKSSVCVDKNPQKQCQQNQPSAEYDSNEQNDLTTEVSDCNQLPKQELQNQISVNDCNIPNQQEPCPSQQSCGQLPQQNIAPKEDDCCQTTTEQPCPPDGQSGQLLQDLPPAEINYDQIIKQDPCLAQLPQQSTASQECNDSNSLPDDQKIEQDPCLAQLPPCISEQSGGQLLQESPESTENDCYQTTKQQSCTSDCQNEQLLQDIPPAEINCDQNIQQDPCLAQLPQPSSTSEECNDCNCFPGLQQFFSLPPQTGQLEQFSKTSECQPTQEEPCSQKASGELQKNSASQLHDCNQEMPQQPCPPQIQKGQLLQNSKTAYCRCDKKSKKSGIKQPPNEKLPQKSRAPSVNNCNEENKQESCPPPQLIQTSPSSRVSIFEKPSEQICITEPDCEEVPNESPKPLENESNQQMQQQPCPPQTKSGQLLNSSKKGYCFCHQNLQSGPVHPSTDKSPQQNLAQSGCNCNHQMQYHTSSPPPLLQPNTLSAECAGEKPNQRVCPHEPKCNELSEKIPTRLERECSQIHQQVYQPSEILQPNLISTESNYKQPSQQVSPPEPQSTNVPQKRRALKGCACNQKI